jgi:hypothetical protein
LKGLQLSTRRAEKYTALWNGAVENCSTAYSVQETANLQHAGPRSGRISLILYMQSLLIMNMEWC